MKSNHITYDYEKSFKRLDDILGDSYVYEEVDEIPDRDKLTYNNGYYVQCNAIFVDIRGSSQLPAKYKNPTLARIYKSYISEIIAIMNGYEICKEINIVGDCVSGIFEAIKKDHSRDMIIIAARIHSLVKTLNYKLGKKKLDPIKIGIGVSKGRALMTLAGYNGSGIKDVVWMGNVVNHASNLCNEANKGTIDVITIADNIYKDLEGYKNVNGQLYQSWFQKANGFYHGNVIILEMEEWLKNQK